MRSGKPWRIAAMGGDGIGPEVMAATLRSLAVLRDAGLPLDWEELPWPATAWHQTHGTMMPEDGLERLRQYDALLMGALGDPGPLQDAGRYHLPDHTSLAPLLELRKGFDLFICERPARLLPGARRYLADPRAAEVDLLVIRENSEGEYVGQGGRLHRGTPREIATQVELFTRSATERLMGHAFRRARARAKARRDSGSMRRFGDDREAQVCLVTKRNALAHAGELYCEVFDAVAAEYPDIAVHHELVDAACMKFVQSPWQFDVVVASNLQGDILTDLAAVLCGGMALAPSCNINPLSREAPALFEPTHGSAPDIAGQDRADPRAMLLTAAMMLEWLGRDDTLLHSAGATLRAAVAADLAEHAAPELQGQTRGTSAIGSAIAERLRRELN